MNKKKSPPNFKTLMTNPKREQAERYLAKTLHALQHEHDVEPSLLADILFEFSMSEMEPDELTSPSAIIWLAQLKRFHTQLQDKITAFEDRYRDEPTH